MKFKRSVVSYGITPEPVTPYQKAAQAWDERVGSARVQAANWRAMAFGCLALAGLRTAGPNWHGRPAPGTPLLVGGRSCRAGRAGARRPPHPGGAVRGPAGARAGPAPSRGAHPSPPAAPPPPPGPPPPRDPPITLAAPLPRPWGLPCAARARAPPPPIPYVRLARP